MKDAQARMTTTQFKDLEQALGVKYNAKGLLADVALREVVYPASMTTFDAMHCLVSGGLYNRELWRCITADGRNGAAEFAKLREYCKKWQWPTWLAKKGKSVHQIFSPANYRSCHNAGTFKCMASQLLTCYPVVRRYSEEHWPCTPSTTSHLLICNVLDIVAIAKSGKQVGDEFRAGVEAYLTASVNLSLIHI